MFVFCVCYCLFEKNSEILFHIPTLWLFRTVTSPYIDQIHRHFLLFPSTFLFLHFALWQCLVTSEEDKGKRNPHLPRTMLVFCLCLVFPSPLTNLGSPHTPMGSEFHSRHLRIPRCFLPYKTLPPPLPQSPHFDFLAVQKPYQWISLFLPHPAIGLHFFIFFSFYSAPYPLFFYPPFALKVLSISSMLPYFYPVPDRL